MTSPASGGSGALMPANLGRFAGIAGIAISLVCLLAVGIWALHQPAPPLPSGGEQLAALAGGIALYALGTVLRSERWRWLLRRSDADASRADAYALTAVGYMGNNVLPARGGDALKVYLGAPRFRTGMRNVLGTLVAERLLDLMVLLGTFALLAYVVLRGIDAPSGARLAAIAGAIAVVAVVAALAVYSIRHTERGRRLLSFVAPMTVATRRLRGRFAAGMVALTAVIWLLEAGTWLAVADSIGLAMSPIEALYLVALGSIFALIPSGPAYAGTLDALVVFGVSAIGGTGSEAVAYILALRFVLMGPITAVGLVLLVVRYGGWSRARAARAEAGA